MDTSLLILLSFDVFFDTGRQQITKFLRSFFLFTFISFFKISKTRTKTPNTSHFLFLSFFQSFIRSFSRQPAVTTVDLSAFFSVLFRYSTLIFFFSLILQQKTSEISPSVLSSFLFFLKYYLYRHTDVHTVHLCFMLLRDYFLLINF